MMGDHLLRNRVVDRQLVGVGLTRADALHRHPGLITIEPGHIGHEMAQRGFFLFTDGRLERGRMLRRIEQQLEQVDQAVADTGGLIDDIADAAPNAQIVRPAI